ncbi:MAG: sigma-70 family RNA polymerase sigma factor [Acidobacteria bacterium]|nr:sigma-70 family RNA polymerase sigma factor [Acidobacteriota bacterium]
MSELTQWLQAARSGDRVAIERVCAATYAELHALAHARIMRSGRLTLLDTTSLVHETFLRLLNAGRFNIDDRSHFLAYAATVMRSVIVDYARQRSAARRGGADSKIAIDSDVPENVAAEEEIVRVNDALDELRQIDERMARIIEMRYFAGLTFEEVAASLELSERTIRREWEKARAILYTTLGTQ